MILSKFKILFIVLVALSSGVTISSERNKIYTAVDFYKIKNFKDAINEAASTSFSNQVKHSTNSITFRGIDLETREVEIELRDSDDRYPLVIRARVVPAKEQGEYRVRVFNGNFVDTQLNEIIKGRLAEKEKGAASVSGIEVGRVIFKDLFGWPVDVIAALGVAVHDDKGKGGQNKYSSFTGFIKLEWKKFPWNHYVRTKIEFGEGLNYTNRVPYDEGLTVRNKSDGRDSKLLNYLGVGISVNAGDITGVEELEECYVGGYAYHRSGVFGAVDMFNNVNGGSNFQTFSFECAF